MFLVLFVYLIIKTYGKRMKDMRKNFPLFYATFCLHWFYYDFFLFMSWIVVS